MDKKYILMCIACTIVSATYAQDNKPDTIQQRNLQEVVVTAPKVIKKIDKDIYIPTSDAKKLSANGLQLISNLWIPTLMVNDVMGSVTAMGGSVQVRVNGRIATVNELKQIDPEYIKRVEWISHPGMKYGGANAVINIITINPTVGGSFMAQALHSPTQAWCQDMASLKLNHGRSQWSIDVQEKLTNKLEVYREYSETFTYPDGKKLTRTETPLDGSLTENRTNLSASYNYLKPDTTMVYVQLSGFKQWNGSEDYEGMMTLSDNSNNIILRDKTGSDGFTPKLSTYFEHHIDKSQILSVDASVAHYYGYSRHIYKEHPYNSDNEIISDVNTSIHDRNTSFGVTVNYEKEWAKSKFTAGAVYSGALNKSTYENLANQVFHQSQNRVYLFGEYRHSINKVTLTGGLGVQYDTYHLRESDRGQSNWDLRPQISVYYTPSQASWWFLTFNTWQTSPTLNQTNSVPRQIDGFQWETGNPDLKTYSSYSLSANYGYSSNRIAGQIGIYAQSQPNAIAPFYNWDGDRLITAYENSRYNQKLAVTISPTIHVIPNWASLSGYLRWGVTRTKGTGYNLTRHFWGTEVQAAIYHWNFQLLLKYERLGTTLIGECESWEQRASHVLLAYNWGKWQFAAGLFCPFNKYDMGARLLNRYNNYEKHIRSNAVRAMPVIMISYNLQWGRQKRGVKKRVSTDTSVEQSEAGSR